MTFVHIAVFISSNCNSKFVNLRITNGGSLISGFGYDNLRIDLGIICEGLVQLVNAFY